MNNLLRTYIVLNFQTFLPFKFFLVGIYKKKKYTKIYQMFQLSIKNSKKVKMF